MRGRPLTREEFHLAMAFGVLNFTNKNCGLSEFDDYDVFANFCYEDEERFAYIMPEQRPLSSERLGDTGSGKVRACIIGPGLPPEEIHWDRLRPEQRAFFERNIPEVAARFNRST